MKKVLFLMTADPLGIGGGEFATRSHLKAICDITNGNVDILITDDWKRDYKNFFNIKKIYSVPPRTRWQVISQYFRLIIDRFAKRAIQIASDNFNDYSCVIVNGSIMAGSIAPRLKKMGLPVISIYHNYEPEYYRDNFKGLKKMLFLPAVKVLERRAYLNSSRNLFLSSQDMNHFASIYGKNNGYNTVLGVYEYNEKKLSISNNIFQKESLTFVITGSLNFEQGVDGILFFFMDLYKYLPLNSRVIISGRNPTQAVRSICSQYANVELVPNPKDINEIISKGDVYVCPTRLGGGVKLRVMDGLRLGLPVITHTCSARGYDLFWNNPSFKVFSTGLEFKDAVQSIVSLFNHGGLDKESVVSEYKKVFSYNAGMNRMKDAINELIK